MIIVHIPIREKEATIFTMAGQICWFEAFAEKFAGKTLPSCYSFQIIVTSQDVNRAKLLEENYLTEPKVSVLSFNLLRFLRSAKRKGVTH